MDKYEFNIKLEQIKKLAAKKEYKQAADIAKEMNWNKIKDWSTLATIINVQEAAGDYEEARDMAILAYNRNLGGRKLIYKLTEFFIKAYEEAGATDLYDDGGEDELKGSSTATSHTSNNNSTSTPPPYGDIGDVGVVSTDGYDLDQYYVTDTLLDGLTQEEVRILLNALYAHYGYTFTTEQYAQFFSSKPWYSSRGTSMSDCESMFNDYERKNKETITAYESRKGWR